MSDMMISDRSRHTTNHQISGFFTDFDGESYYKITHVDQMPPFFISLVSGSDHWFFIASNGGLSAGRQNANSALFPYETEDKLIANAHRVGSKTILRVHRAGQTYLWEPFSPFYEGLYHCGRNLYKNTIGNKLVFEEINHDLQLTWRTTWRTGDRFGFIKTTTIINNGPPVEIDVLDGLENLMPFGATETLQTTMSSLLNAYKRSEVNPQTGIAAFSLSATLTDRAEPSESLMATIAWQTGLEWAQVLLSTSQVAAFRSGQSVKPEQDVCGKPAAYFVTTNFELNRDSQKEWHIVADVNQEVRDVVALNQLILERPDQLIQMILEDIDDNSEALVRFVGAGDGIQYSANQLNDVHHFANVVFNIMRGGIFFSGYWVEKRDLVEFVKIRNRPFYVESQNWFESLPDLIQIHDLYNNSSKASEPNLERLILEYLPLTFSRRHGDPSRPWNRFSINLKNQDGSPRLDYQGNWRDIFQNWEPLGVGYPIFVRGMISKFLNAVTIDGYNPYRVTREGIEWEVPEPDNPWANIGYWSDHQIIYLQKLVEIADNTEPDYIESLWNQRIFSTPNVPYRLRPYSSMLADWYDTIDFDWETENEVEQAVDKIGTDGRLRITPDGEIYHQTMIEKLLVLLLAKMTNLVPEGGIWMNTQRPEWNDANNALVGKGISVVTAAYLYRFVNHWRDQLDESKIDSYDVHRPLLELFEKVNSAFESFEEQLNGGFDGHQRRAFMDVLGQAATDFRTDAYDPSLGAEINSLSRGALNEFLVLCASYLAQTLQANRRDDDLYHSYNILQLTDQTAEVDNLYLMLEGQVAILSSGLLSVNESLALLQSIRKSKLYREDQQSYMLYPHRTLPKFMDKNHVLSEHVLPIPLIKKMIDNEDYRLMNQDQLGYFHFNGTFRNEFDVTAILDEIAQSPDYASLVQQDRSAVLSLFEETFDHEAFTGRSGTFFAYEGLGSVYWHMVSKLLLAVQETYQSAREDKEVSAETLEGLAEAYVDVRSGIGFNKRPEEYGAFPTDPYSHTPYGRGAQQPGMTGQVKEEILTRWGELGATFKKGFLTFNPMLVQRKDFLSDPTQMKYYNVWGSKKTLDLPAGSLGFTFCQVPIIYSLNDRDAVHLTYQDGRQVKIERLELTKSASRQIIERTGEIQKIQVYLDAKNIS